MSNIKDLEPKQVFSYFEEISRIPRGSGNMKRISDFCMAFAKTHGLKAVQDEANNVIIYKPGTKGYEAAEPVILQGHLDMVCQKEENYAIDFEKEGLTLYTEGDFIKARGTTLGADNGIAVSMILAILADDALSHPPIEAVFTTDEEIGMVGALALSFDKLSGKKMINIDSEDSGVVTVSCAGGSDFKAVVPLARKMVSGTRITLSVKGLTGGHSGVEIHSGRINANMLMGRILNHMQKEFSFTLISIDGGDKGNAIPVSSVASIVVEEKDAFLQTLWAYFEEVKQETLSREAGLYLEVEEESGQFEAIGSPQTDMLIRLLLSSPNGVIAMSREIENLVETSLNLGILQTEKDTMTFSYALRSNKKTALLYLEELLETFFGMVDCSITKSGHYPPWEYNKNSVLTALYCEKYAQKFGKAPSVEAIHAGLECGVFASGIEGFDGISIGPEMHGIHTVHERLSISSTKEVYELILSLLSALK